MQQSTISQTIRNIYNIDKNDARVFYNQYELDTPITVENMRAWGTIPAYIADSFTDFFHEKLEPLHHILRLHIDFDAPQIPIHIILTDTKKILSAGIDTVYTPTHALEFLLEQLHDYLGENPTHEDTPAGDNDTYDFPGYTIPPEPESGYNQKTGATTGANDDLPPVGVFDADGYVIPESGDDSLAPNFLLNDGEDMSITAKEVLNIMDTSQFNNTRMIALCLDMFGVLPSAPCVIKREEIPLLSVFLEQLTGGNDDIDEGYIELHIPLADYDKNGNIMYFTSGFTTNSDGSILFRDSIVPAYLIAPGYVTDLCVIIVHGLSRSYHKNVTTSLYTMDKKPVEYVGSWIGAENGVFLGQTDKDTADIDTTDILNNNDIRIIGEEVVYTDTDTIIMSDDTDTLLPPQDDGENDDDDDGF